MLCLPIPYSSRVGISSPDSLLLPNLAPSHGTEHNSCPTHQKMILHTNLLMFPFHFLKFCLHFCLFFFHLHQLLILGLKLFFLTSDLKKRLHLQRFETKI